MFFKSDLSLKNNIKYQNKKFNMYEFYFVFVQATFISAELVNIITVSQNKTTSQTQC